MSGLVVEDLTHLIILLAIGLVCSRCTLPSDSVVGCCGPPVRQCDCFDGLVPRLARSGSSPSIPVVVIFTVCLLGAHNLVLRGCLVTVVCSVIGRVSLHGWQAVLLVGSPYFARSLVGVVSMVHQFHNWHGL